MLTAYKTCVSQCIILFLFFLSQISKSVNDDTKNKIQCYNNNNKEKQQVIHNSKHKQWFLFEKNNPKIYKRLNFKETN